MVDTTLMALSSLQINIDQLLPSKQLPMK